MADLHLEAAASLITAAAAAPPVAIHSFFDEDSFTFTHVVADTTTGCAAIIDSVLDFDPASGRTATASADRVIDHVRRAGWQVEWVLETHVHADHLSAAPYLRETLGGRLAIGRQIIDVQTFFGSLFNEGADFARDGSQFDHLFDDGAQFTLGSVPAMALHVPGHTPADMAYVIGGVVFVGDTLFMPDYGTARADFPGGSARTLYRSIRRLLSLPASTRLYLCHDYRAPGRDHFAWTTTVADERAHNIHVRDGESEAAFVRLREARDATLDMPRLILPSIQVNMRAGHLPPPQDNGVRYLKLPLDQF